MLRRAHQKHGGEKDKWVKMSKYFKQWDNDDCLQRWYRSIKPDIKHQCWTPEEDAKVSISFASHSFPFLTLTLLFFAKIADHVKQHGTRKWVTLAATLPGRTNAQCRTRWLQVLDTSIKRSRWSASEVKILMEAHKKLGNKWEEISKLIDGRTCYQCETMWRRMPSRKR